MDNKKFTVVTAIADINDLTVKQAERTFFAYRNKGIIKGGTFSDDEWHICDEYANYTLDFGIDETEFRELGSFLDIDIADFKKWLKTYVISQFGALAMGSIRNFLCDMRKVVSTPITRLEGLGNTETIIMSMHVTEFFSVLPSESMEDNLAVILDKLESIEEKTAVSMFGRQRTLAAFESYFRFNDIVNDYWEKADNIEEKLFFFPVWLWWNVSGVLPMRPRELVLTTRRCLSEIDGRYYLTVRKSKIKGSGKTKSYKISEDYKTVKYEIPERIAKEIRWYIEATDCYMDNELYTLFSLEVHYEKWERSKGCRNRYYTYVNLCTCLRYFFNEIVCGGYGYSIVLERGEGYQLADNEINYLHLGDTRHLALINLIAEGATPMVAMMLAGHDNPEMSSHYYSNIATLIECKTYRQYKKLIKGKQNYCLSKPVSSLSVGEFIKLDHGGRCYSERVRNEDFSDCCKVYGPAGEIGYCKSCTYYRDDGKAFNDGKEMYVNRLKYECSSLADIVEKVRKGYGETEEITQVLLKLRDAEYSYQQYLLETGGK